MNRKLLLLVLLPLAACAQPFEGRVAARLSEAGLPRGVAECMAKRWVDRLNVLQLQKISSMADELGRANDQQRLTLIGFIERVRAIDDPEILEVVTISAAACALAG